MKSRLSFLLFAALAALTATALDVRASDLSRRLSGETDQGTEMLPLAPTIRDLIGRATNEFASIRINDECANGDLCIYFVDRRTLSSSTSPTVRKLL